MSEKEKTLTECALEMKKESGLANKFEVGDEVMFDEYKTKVEIRGFATNGDLIIEDRNGILFLRKPKYVSPLKKKDELEKGDKFIDSIGNKVEVLGAEYDEVYEQMQYFCRQEGGFVSIWNDREVEEIIYD